VTKISNGACESGYRASGQLGCMVQVLLVISIADMSVYHWQTSCSCASFLCAAISELVIVQRAF
jgi:hypothetical protein